MIIKISIVGDTHSSSFKDLPKQILQYVKESNWIIHVGDYTSLNIVEGFKRLKPYHFRGVYGNADPLLIRKSLSPKIVIEIAGKRIGIIHPESGGSETFLKKRILREFRTQNLDVIAYGHTHEVEIQWLDKTLLVNPGRGYIDEYSSHPNATIVMITINEEIIAEVKEINY